MTVVIKPKKSTTAGSVPTTSNLADGELAVNAADKRIFVRNGTNIVELSDIDLPLNLQNANYTFALTDRGKIVYKNNSTGYTYTIPLGSSVPFPQGAPITVRNKNATGNITIARTSGVVLRKAGSGTDANITVAPWGFATLVLEGTDEWVVSGTGIT